MRPSLPISRSRRSIRPCGGPYVAPNSRAARRYGRFIRRSKEISPTRSRATLEELDAPICCLRSPTPSNPDSGRASARRSKPIMRELKPIRNRRRVSTRSTGSDAAARTRRARRCARGQRGPRRRDRRQLRAAIADALRRMTGLCTRTGALALLCGRGERPVCSAAREPRRAGERRPAQGRLRRRRRGGSIRRSAGHDEDSDDDPNAKASGTTPTAAAWWWRAAPGARAS